MNQTRVLRADPLTLDLADQTAILAGKPIELGPKVFTLLKALMEAPLRVVTKEELFETVWDGRFVSEAVLTTAVKELRRALRDDAREPEFIATVHGRGYRFLKPVEAGAEHAAPAPDVAADGTMPTIHAERKSSILRVSAGLVAVLVIIAVAVMGPMLGNGTRVGSNARMEVASLAVLPFEDLSPARDQGYLADGIAEEILNVLTSVDGLATASRTSSFAYRGNAGLTVRQIARELGVGHILEGSVRANGSRMRVVARLVDAASGQTVWSRDYEREFSVVNVYRIEDEVAERVVSHLGIALPSGLGGNAPGSRTAASGTTNLRAYQLYLRARGYFHERREEDVGIDMMHEATRLDPKFARAWELLAALSFVGGEQGSNTEPLAAANRALELDPNLSLAHAVKGMIINYTQPADWSAGIECLEEALALDPKNTTALLWLGSEMHKLGYLERSQGLLERCLDLDPAYDVCRLHLSWVLLMRGQTERALEEHHRLVRDGLEPSDAMFLQTFVMRGDDKNVAASLSRLPGETPMPAIVLAALRQQPKDMAPVHKALRDWAMHVSPRYSIYPIALELGAYELYAPLLVPNLALWLPGTPEFRQSEDFRWAIRALNIEPYWREHGFPDLCWPTGSSTFECS
jgi:adenylate cyclase